MGGGIPGSTMCGRGLLFCGHSKPRLNYPVFTAFTENGYSEIRLLKFW